MKRTFVINGNNIDDIPSFYGEINRVFMGNESWEIAHSLDAFNDLLYGGIGALPNEGPATLVWKQWAKNREDLGPQVTRSWYRNKIKQGKRFNVALLQERLADLESGKGPTFFGIVMEIIADHPRIELVKE